MVEAVATVAGKPVTVGAAEVELQPRPAARWCYVKLSSRARSSFARRDSLQVTAEIKTDYDRGTRTIYKDLTLLG